MVFDMAREFDRAVVVSGRSLVNNIERGRDLGFMRMPPELFTDQTIPDVSPERMVVIATGSQGEPLSALSRIASGEHRQLSIMEGDTVIMSSRVIPGNARAVNRLINQMYRMGADVATTGRAPCTFPAMVGATSSAPCSTPYGPSSLCRFTASTAI